MERGLEKRAKAVIITALGNSSLRMIQDCITTEEAWNRFQIRFSSKMTITELKVAIIMLNVGIGRI